LLPVRLKISRHKMAIATIVTTPIFNSDHASDRVRGIARSPELPGSRQLKNV
jgi:hypothetical protein